MKYPRAPSIPPHTVIRADATLPALPRDPAVSDDDAALVERYEADNRWMDVLKLLATQAAAVAVENRAAFHLRIALFTTPPMTSSYFQPMPVARMIKSLVTGFIPGSGFTSTKFAMPSRSRRMSTRATSRRPNAFQTSSATDSSSSSRKVLYWT